MADGDLRELELAWARERTVPAEAAYLQARVGAGVLTIERLQLAAFLGHPAARALADGRPPRPRRPAHRHVELVPVGPWRELLEWAQSLDRWSLDLVPRATIEVYETVLQRRPRADVEADWSRELIAAARVALDDPTPANIAALQGPPPGGLAADRQRFLEEQRSALLFGAGHVGHCVDTLHTDRRSMATENARGREDAVIQVALLALVSLERAGVPDPSTIQDEAARVLITWALA
ncbi:MAG: hypothetical protein M9894_22860 [Planctomycetes bacterium]|nr:hypothetical protein [Planctomycetota bacterium]